MDTVDPTADGILVDPPVTDPAPVVSPATPPSDPAKRIANLQSQIDKMKATLDKATASLEATAEERNKAVLARAELQQTLATTQAATGQIVDQATKATTEALDLAQRVQQDNANLNARLAKLTTVVQNPDIAAWADLVPETSDPTALAKAVETIRKARQTDVQAVKDQLASGITPPATPSIVTGKPLEGKALHDHLMEAIDNPKEFEKRLAALAAAQS